MFVCNGVILSDTYYMSLPVGSPFKRCILNDPTTRAMEYCRW